MSQENVILNESPNESLTGTADGIPEIPAPVRRVPRAVWREGSVAASERTLAEETPVALTYNGTTHAVMMASPLDIADFALGFSLTEGIISAPADILSLDVVAVEDGIEARMWIEPARMSELSARRRHLAGPTGCGLCGVESLAEAVRPAALVRAEVVFTGEDLMAGMAALAPAQTLNHETRAVHAAGFHVPGQGLLAVCEDVGRHNALDKLVGRVVRLGLDPAAGMVLLTSRVSIEMVQKAALLGAGIIAAVSAPTSLAVRTAERAGLTLAAVVRSDGFEVFTHPRRIRPGPSARHSHVA